VKMSASLH